MIIYDITREIFSSRVYPGDTAPSVIKIKQIEKGDSYNLSDIRMCVHNGTHIDAPAHFIKDGNTIEQIALHRCIGPSTVIETSGKITQKMVVNNFTSCEKKILIKGNAILSEGAVKELIKSGIELLGTELQSVGKGDSEENIHHLLLENNIVILEGIVLDDVPPGNYFLSASPVKLGGLEGAPCRAVLIKFEESEKQERSRQNH